MITVRQHSSPFAIHDTDSHEESIVKSDNAELPLCDRCHDLLHHHRGSPILHPSIGSLHDTIGESPWRHNHIYHVVDAADFPMSVISDIHKELATSLQRSKNRRAKHAGFRYGKKTEISFIVTRSDLLAPRKEQVDRMMTWIVSVLRKALGDYAEHVRLGNVRCVSAKRGWWTRDLKADIWDRGGGGWMVGKVNVGKSKLFESVFPKGRTEDVNIQGFRSRTLATRIPGEHEPSIAERSERVDDTLLEDGSSLLPPARAETPYPTMPTISSLPGTTAAPIRIPFGDGKGELIDLPGLARSNLESYVKPECQGELIMKARAVPQQFSLHSGRSLLLGDVVRITPRDPDLTVLAYPFVPIPAHLTSTTKAIDIQNGGRSDSTGLPLMLTAEGQGVIKSAGTVKLRWDVTKERSGPLTTKSGVGLKAQDLPFKVLSTDLLIEGVGWVELVAQVRRRPRGELKRGLQAEESREKPFADKSTAYATEDTDAFPEVEVFTPEGRFIGSRQPLGAWLLNSTNTKPGKIRTVGRPRKSMASAKRSRLPSTR